MRSLLTAFVSLGLILALASCGGGGTTTVTVSGQEGGEIAEGGVDVSEMTKQQWLGVKLGSSKEEVIEQVGNPTSESDLGDLVNLSYSLASPDDASVGFALEDGELVSKVWQEFSYTEGTISAAKYAKVEDGMTEQQVEEALGAPYERSDEFSSYSEPAMGQNPPGTLQRCLIYQTRQESQRAYEVCFGTAGGVNWTYPPPSG
jgi:outer membrane protein assembly factor BamE (lipoprotein component of BamABCDE complex)